KVRLSVIATGIGGTEAQKSRPEPVRPVRPAARPAPRPSVMPWRDEANAAQASVPEARPAVEAPRMVVRTTVTGAAVGQPYDEVRPVTPPSVAARAAHQTAVQASPVPAAAAPAVAPRIEIEEEPVARAAPATARQPDVDPTPAIQRLKQRVEEAA